MTSNYGEWPGEHDEIRWQVGPDFSIPYSSGQSEHHHGGQHRHMGPVYDVPPFPQHDGREWQQPWGGHHPPVYGQDHMGPVYAVPSYPWQQWDSHGAGGGQWHHSQGWMPWWMHGPHSDYQWMHPNFGY